MTDLSIFVLHILRVGHVVGAGPAIGDVAGQSVGAGFGQKAGYVISET